MFNLLRMDLYRVKRGKSVYICFGALLAATAFVFGMMWLLATPQGQEISLRIGMLSANEVNESDYILEGYDSLIFYRDICLDGGAYNLIKNVMALHQNRWNYIGSKVMTAWIVDFCYLVLNLLAVLLLNRMCGDMVPYAGWTEILFYLSWIWFVTTAFAALIIFICVLTRSVAAGSLAAFLFGSGAVVRLLLGILNMFHKGEWLKYSISMTCELGPEKYTSVKDLYVYAVGFGFLILYTRRAGIVMKKKDI